MQTTVGALVFTSAAPEDCVTFTVTDDNVQEGTESFNVQFVLPSGNQFQFSAGTTDTAVVTIFDDDSKKLKFTDSACSFCWSNL